MAEQNEQTEQNYAQQQQQAPLQQVNTLPYSFQPQQIQYVQQPLIQSQVVAQPVGLVANTQQILNQSAVHVSTTAVTSNREVVKGESRIEYVPYEKTIIEYEAVTRVEYVPREKKVTDYYAIEYQTEYIPQVYQDKYIEYIPQERLQERVEYQAIEKQVVHQPVQETQQVIVQQVPVAQQLVSSQVQLVPQSTVAYQPVTYQTVPVQQSFVYQAPVQQQQLTSTYTVPTVNTTNVQAPAIATNLQKAQVQQVAPKKEKEGFLEKLFG